MSKDNYLKRYYSIVNGLILRSFPNLKNKKIKIYESKNLKFSADAKKLPWILRIRTNPRLRKYSKKQLIGIFAHELSHLEKFVNDSWFEYYILRYFKAMSKRFIKNEEIETDKQAIRKGYAKELYLQRNSRWKAKGKKIEKIRKLYISPTQIKEYALSIGKWN